LRYHVDNKIFVNFFAISLYPGQMPLL